MSTMLTESFILATQGSEKTPVSSSSKDVGIYMHQFRPTSTPRSTFKKSSTGTNGLAVTPSHVFAGQSGKAVVHVYSRLKHNQEATVPFPDRIHCITTAGGVNGEVLVLGTEGGRLLLWEVCLGRSFKSFLFLILIIM
jgi:pre-rRNA-processing protein IPI3